MKIPLDILEHLDALAKARGIPRHQLIREALAEYVERHERPAERATTEKAKPDEPK